MEEKKTIKVSLGTAICIFIIFLLLISIVIMCYSNKNKDVSDEDKTSVSSKNLTKKSNIKICLLYTSPSPRDQVLSRMPSSA